MSANHPLETEAWAIASDLRRNFRLTMPNLIRELHQRSLLISYQELNFISEMWGAQSDLEPIPAWLVDFIGKYLEPLNPSSILDPFGRSLLLIPIADVVNASTLRGLISNKDDYESVTLIPSSKPITWIYGNPDEWLATTQDHFDCILSIPPLGTPKQSLTLDLGAHAIQIKSDFGSIRLLMASSRLTENGEALFVTTAGFARPDDTSSVYAHLSKFGLHIHAALYIPTGTFWSTSAELLLVIIRRAESPRLFVGELSTDTKHNETLLTNLLARKAGQDISLGKLVDPARFTSYRALATQERTKSLGRISGLPPINLTDVAISIERVYSNRRTAFADRPNTVYLPIIGRSPAVTSIADFTLKPDNYIQIVLDPEKAVDLYVAGFFNTVLGQLIREQVHSGVYIPKISKSSVANIQLYLPDVQTQIRIIEADTRIANLTNELRELQTKLWAQPRQLRQITQAVDQVNRSETFAAWLDVLPFPLSSILWTYHTSGDDNETRFKRLLHFFEALAQFYATTLLGGFLNDQKEFEAARADYTRAITANVRQHGSFGTWVQIAATLSKCARAMINGQAEAQAQCESMFRTSNRDVLDMLFSSQLIGVLQRVNGVRNDWEGHGGYLPPALARQLRATLESHLSAIRGVMSRNWQDYHLIKPGAARYANGTYDYQIELVMGRSTPFEATRITTSEALEDGELYLHTPTEQRALKLLPLVRILPSPGSVENACYFYNRTEGKNVRFVTYHFASEAEIVEPFQSTLQALDTIMG